MTTTAPLMAELMIGLKARKQRYKELIREHRKIGYEIRSKQIMRLQARINELDIVIFEMEELTATKLERGGV